jgi:putative FmdB family regulatory protein
VPTYEYQCNACGRIFEIRQRISEPALTRCETCGGVVKRLLSAAPFILKGEGWYVTDYPSESRKKARESEKSAGEKSAGEKSAGEKKDGEKSAGEKKDGEKSAGEKSAGEKKDGAPAEKSPSSSSAPSTSASAPVASKTPD